MVVVEGFEDETRVDVASVPSKPTVLHGYPGSPTLATAQSSHTMTSARQKSELCDCASRRGGKAANASRDRCKEDDRRLQTNPPKLVLETLTVTALSVKVTKG